MNDTLNYICGIQQNTLLEHMHKGCSRVLFSEKLIALFIIHKNTQNGTRCFGYFLSLAYFYFL